MKNIFIIVPTLDPDEKIMLSFINELRKEFENILVINDGSKVLHNQFFNKLEKKGIEVIKHYKNLGKGRAIKDAFNYLLNKYPNIDGVVTCDSDGQHSVNDIKKCAEKLMKYKDRLILGVRNFDNPIVPWRSKFGNKTTRNIFKFFIGAEISDTQTGLRALSKELVVEFLDLFGERYEYETEMLIACRERGIKIQEVEIQTIYLDNNKASHFNPLKDSLKIYKLFSKYFLISFSLFCLDIVLFLIIMNILKINSKILAATIISRVISAALKYTINYKLVFRDMKAKNIIKYMILIIIEMLLSGCFVNYLFNLFKFNIVIIKVIVDFILWIISVIVYGEFIGMGDKNA